ncbi:hypothetical protein XELAEV_18012010mg [Xenopus laevis]|uniref:Uncharacterized protein n=1 Tax=Xenopus laevis TaxID=8355 RepID=A0A974HY06_XENLA|nr:hypothetical protein XELAEV_18012010mg [Xenopus laevis]
MGDQASCMCFMEWIHRCGCLLQVWMSLPICVNPQGKVCHGEGRKRDDPGWFLFMTQTVDACHEGKGTETLCLSNELQDFAWHGGPGNGLP